MPKNQKTTIHCISHTHWDREWYLPFQDYRIRLVKLLDSLLERLLKHPDYKTFHMDAQTVVLEDYLEICPERRAELEKLVRSQKILIGPWYILPDEFLVSGEATIRNLMLGHKLAGEFGRVMKVGYVPDPFGHISQMPQILRGFDLDNFIFMRGYDSAGGTKTSEFIWEAPDGSRVCAYYLPDGYGNGAWLNLFPDDPKKCAEIIQKTLKKITPWSTMPHLLLMNGTDHLTPEFEIPGILRRLKAEFPEYHFTHATLENFVRQAGKHSMRRPLVRGELRQNGEFAPLLYGVLSARNYLKQNNHAVQILLEKWAEPAAAAAWLFGVPHPQKFIWQAWKYLLQNHPHDSICGCSIDPVHEQMMTRFAWAWEIGKHVTDSALAHIAARIKTSEAPDIVRNAAVFNPLARKRSGCVEFSVDLPADSNDDFHLLDNEGRPVPFAALYSVPENKTHIHDRTYPYWEQVKCRRIIVAAENIPACGYASFAVRSGKALQSPDFTKVKCGKNSVENQYLRLQMNADGTLQITDRQTGRIWKNLNAFEDMADVGDEYNYSYPEKDFTVKSRNVSHKWQLLNDGNLRAGFQITMKLPLPKSISADRKSRSEETTPCLLETTALLAAGARRVEFTTKFLNNAGDHDLRVLFASGARKAKFSEAMGQFDVIKRPIGVKKRGPNAVEDQPARHPMDGFVDVSDNDCGLLVSAEGLHEYEVKDDGTIAITLLRAVGWLSRPDLKTRNGDAGPSLPTPGAQCPGEHVFRYCLVPHSGNWEQGGAWNEVMEFLHPVRCVTLPLAAKSFDGNYPVLPSAEPPFPPNASLLSIEPDSMILSALKKAEGRNSLIVRAWNIGTRRVKAKFNFNKNIKRAYSVNLAEKRLKRLKVENGNKINILCGPKQIVSIELE